MAVILCTSEIYPNGSMEQYYFWTTSASPDSIDSIDWNETTPGRLYIHYTPEGGVLHTFTLFSNGTFMVQGEAKTLDAWRNTHFPELNERYMNSTDIFVPSMVPEHSFEDYSPMYIF